MIPTTPWPPEDPSIECKLHVCLFGLRTARTCGPRSSRMQPHSQGLSCFLWKVHSYNSQAAHIHCKRVSILCLTSAMGMVESRNDDD
jgi:hypothetical protein